MTRARSQLRGFTLAEMLIVLAVSLILMTLTLPIFHVTSRTVQNVERKLAVYEAARNILDVMELEIQQACMNERGDHFSLKRVTFPDTDPFTPGGTTPYSGSQREACSLDYMKHQAGGLLYNGNTPYRGGTPFALCYPPAVGTTFEGYISTLRSSLLYNFNTQTTSLADVSQLTYYALSSPKCAVPGKTRWSDEPENFGEPGHEVNAPYWSDTSGAAQDDYHITGVALMDLNFAWWDNSPPGTSATSQTWQTPPDGTAIYFAPPPTAIRITITVCDFNKHAYSTFSRIVALPCGSGQAVVKDTRDGVYSDSSTPAFNETKDVQKLDLNAYGTMK